MIDGNSLPVFLREISHKFSIATTLLALKHSQMSVSKLEEKLRASKPPVITRILDDKVLIDLRTVSEREESEILKILEKIS